MTQVSLMLFNVQDMFVFMDKYQGEQVKDLNEYQWQNLTTSLYGHKELSKVIEVAESIKDVNPEVLMLIEVGGRDSVENFNIHFLDKAYKIFHHPSNSDRGIDVAFLVKKESHFLVDLKSYTNFYLSNNRKPSRGFFKLKLKHKNKTKLSIILTHLKSKLDLKKEDFEGRGQRKAEVEFLTKQILQHHKNYPLLIAGDLNGIIYKDQTDEELKVFEKLEMYDVLELIDTPIDQRCTFVYFNKASQRFLMQLDYILIHKNFKDLVDKSSTYVYRFKSNQKIDMGLPDNRLQKSYYPSDHFPLVLNLRLDENNSKN